MSLLADLAPWISLALSMASSLFVIGMYIGGFKGKINNILTIINKILPDQIKKDINIVQKDVNTVTDKLNKHENKYARFKTYVYKRFSLTVCTSYQNCVHCLY